jgi:hypothetical protein
MNTDLLAVMQQLHLVPAPAQPGDALEQLIDLLAGSVRILTNEWWQASDAEVALDAARAGVKRLNLGVTFDEAAFVAVAADVTDEDLRRRHQLGFLVGAINAQLAGKGDERRFRCFGPRLAWEPGEPPWLLVVPEEYAALHALVGGCEGLEVKWDEPSRSP